MNQIQPQLPPDDLSLRQVVLIEWTQILDNWKKGYPQEARLNQLHAHMEMERVAIFETRSKGTQFAWDADWIQANAIDREYRDFVGARKKHAEDVRAMWEGWCDRGLKSLVDLSLEALRAMILINGATMLAAITVLSGQISQATETAKLAASVALLCSLISLIMLAVGHAMGFIVAENAINTVQGQLLGHIRHAKIYAIGRYIRRYVSGKLQISAGLIYGSIVAFGLGAFISSLILICG